MIKSTHLPARLPAFATALLAPVLLGACATASAPGPVEVTRFVAADAVLGGTTLFIESAPGDGADSLELAPYKAAVAAELSRLGYTEQGRGGAQRVAQVAVERFVREEGGRRSPVSVGVGGGTGSYGSGVGVGVGINLGGGSREQVTTRMAVTLRDVASGEVLWEGRAEFDAPEGSEAADAANNAAIIADALFREFPGADGETILVETN